MCIHEHIDPRRKARTLYWQGWSIFQIAQELQTPEPTVRSWKRRDGWDHSTPLERVEATYEARLIQLIAKESKTAHDFKEIDLLGRQMERAARIRKYEQGGNETDLNPKVANRNKNRKPKEKNEFTEEQIEQLRKSFFDSLFDFQRVWYEAGLQNRIRNVLKSRQIGATWYFAREALVDALETGRNQIFISASKAQAHQFRSYIVAFAKSVGVKLQGDPIVLPNGAELIFLSTNSRTAQSYHGNLYVDEYFWIPKFPELRKTAGGMAAHAKWRITYFSTPSTLNHDAYPYWCGSHFNKGRAKKDHIRLDVSHTALAAGSLGKDGQWRQIVTVQDALEGGCTLFDIEQLRLEYSPVEFEQLFMAQFIDDNNSVFPLQLMRACMVDSWALWEEDFKPLAPRPFGRRPVWIGYDPAHTGDSAGCVVIAPPAVPGGKFRILEKYQWSGMDFEEQAEKIKALTKRYVVTHIGIDRTGIGEGVFQLVQKFFPAAIGYQYGPDIKNRLVLKAHNVISKGRLEFDAGWTDVAAAFMAIRRTITASGRMPTYDAARSEESGHADLAWATMHALLNEPLEGTDSINTGFMEISG